MVKSFFFTQTVFIFSSGIFSGETPELLMYIHETNSAHALTGHIICLLSYHLKSSVLLSYLVHLFFAIQM
jgi:hypothetical protein